MQKFIGELLRRWWKGILGSIGLGLLPRFLGWIAQEWTGNQIVNFIDQSIVPLVTVGSVKSAWLWMVEHPMQNVVLWTCVLLVAFSFETKRYEKKKRLEFPKRSGGGTEDRVQPPTPVSQSWHVEDEMGPDMAEAGLTFKDVGISQAGMEKIFDITAKAHPVVERPKTAAENLLESFKIAGTMKEVPVDFRSHGRGVLVSVKQLYDRDRAHNGTVSLEDIAKIDDGGTAKSRLFHHADGTFKYAGGLLETAGIHTATSISFFHGEEHLWWLVSASSGKPEIKWRWANRPGGAKEIPVGKWRVVLCVEVGDRKLTRAVTLQVKTTGVEIVDS